MNARQVLWGAVLTALLVGAAAPLVVASGPATAPVGGAEDARASGEAEPLATQAAVESPCLVEVEKIVAPDLVLVGDPVSVTLHARAVCPGEVFPFHVAMALDASASMNGENERAMRDAALNLVRGMTLTEEGARRAAVVQFDTRALTRVRLTGEEARVLNAVRNVHARPDPPSGSPGPPVTAGPPVTSVPLTPGPGRTVVPGGGDETAIDRGIFEARRQLIAGRRLHADPRAITEVMVLLSDGRDPRGCRPALQQARNVRSDGVLVVAICIGRCDEACMRQIASSPRYYFHARNVGALQGIFQVIRDRLTNVIVRRLEILEVTGEGMAYVLGSADPPATEADPRTGLLRWRFDWVPREGVTATYLTRPLAAGTREVAASSTGWIEDTMARRGDFAFPSRFLAAWEPDVLSAPELGPVSPSPILTVSAPLPTPTVP